MRVFIAGATGAVGTRLVPLLLAAGHEVVGTSRSEARLGELERAGATGVVMNGLDAASVRRAVLDAHPDVIVHQLTALSGQVGDLKRFDEIFAATNALRTRGTDHLLAAAAEAGVGRFVAQSYAGWPTERTGGPVKTEEDPLDPNPTKASRETLAAIRHVEQQTTDAGGLALRYGALYGPGNDIGRGGSVIEMLRARKLPLVGGGAGVWSFCHIDDAASAAAVAVTRGAPGVYNIVDDDPAPVAVWLPELARAIGAKPPMRIPAWMARPLIGEHGVSMMTRVRGASNAKAKRELGWEPAWPSWREGFRRGLG
ncbi:NAD-dependent epimerase/dehydratase family protein [Agromyces ramosus]|uniref:Nucleoside-diphosphate-sugar epimerase n=1 Tax=Agromyces ramosus TaxID=33879 RepID=A0ABU0R3Y0_9MICO|nr:NAD(P)-dependent oxidoreductase [Agromyces ramosus]MDQ0892780.1 nucleoside-diphosphate-sugar epimerase [Agromyces ramosus]